MSAIKSKQEYDKVFEWVVAQTITTLEIGEDEARKRVDALFKSGLLDNFDPADKEHQMIVEVFLSIPSSEYQHLKNHSL